ncbi:hypothetical protein AMJ40_06600 [candidate division TA06 bacterium DG_26]|uniref:Uncharacterized protein n=1 Tax=candidate division TA06 bacterium DG_26 TaxID=1703771 RepID=A0A0S7WFK3_UNCT6|nr:MAG: hypothetical protein AMJ40_06600 [candidate division TA06 bacterium DG_26]
MERNRVVVHFRKGKLLKGYTHDFTPAKDVFHLTSEQAEDRGKIHEVHIDDLKAVFFVKTLEGNKDYVETKRFEEGTGTAQGLKIKLEFFDGEIMSGTSLGYNPNRKGFFVIPVDPQSNNDRIYVVRSALRDIRLGKDAGT